MSLIARHLSRYLGGRCLLDDVSVELAPGEVLALLGPNGAGKSTLLGLLAGEFAPDHGSVVLDHVPLPRHTAATLAQCRALLLQRHGELPGLSVMDVLAIGLYPHGRQPEDTRTELAEALQLADAAHLLGRDYDRLSGGEQARVQFARVVLQMLASSADSRYLLLDEPTASLDLAHQESLMAACRRLALTHRLGIILAVHDLNLAARHADRVLVLKQGKAVASGTPATALTPELVHAVFAQEVLMLPHPERTGVAVFVPK